MAVAAYKNGNCELYEYSRIYSVLKATINRHADSKNVNGIKKLGRLHTYSFEMENPFLNILGECFFD